MTEKVKEMPISKSGGFTLIEMLVVVAIIGLLSSVVIVGLNDARKKARDARRIADLRQVQNGLENFYSSNDQKYPRDTSQLYREIPSAPKDPLRGEEYYYIRKTTQSYILGVCLEEPRPGGVTTLNENVDIGACNCRDVNGYCVAVDDKR